GRSVVGREHLQLVLRGERPPTGPLEHLRIRPSTSSTIHPTRIFDPGRPVEHTQRCCHLGEVSIPALGSLNVRGRLPQPRLAERVTRTCDRLSPESQRWLRRLTVAFCCSDT